MRSFVAGFLGDVMNIVNTQSRDVVLLLIVDASHPPSPLLSWAGTGHDLR
jgi:hypothetical protein